jgi:hypothetical protein
MLNNQGLLFIDNFIALSEKAVDLMCTNICKQGGMTNNLNHNANTPVADFPVVIPNPGLPIGHIKLFT